jgi:hypothetical protein
MRDNTAEGSAAAMAVTPALRRCLFRRHLSARLEKSRSARCERVVIHNRCG